MREDAVGDKSPKNTSKANKQRLQKKGVKPQSATPRPQKIRVKK